MPFLKLPTVIQNAVMLGSDTLEVTGVTVLDAIRDACHKNEKLYSHFFYQNDSIKHQFLLSVDNSQVSTDALISDSDTIEVMIATSGGTAQTIHDLSGKEVQRYSRHLVLPEIGVKGQMALRDAKVLICGYRWPGCACCIIPGSHGGG